MSPTNNTEIDSICYSNEDISAVSIMFFYSKRITAALCTVPGDVFKL